MADRSSSRDRKWKKGPKKGIHPSHWPATSCECQDCRDACLNSPGWFLPAEVEQLAEHLGLSVVETFRRHLAVSVVELADGSLRHGLMPHKLRDRKAPGQVWTLRELKDPGRCTFFDHGRCSIHLVRPYECSRMLHHGPKRWLDLRTWIADRWTTGRLAPFAGWTGKRLRGAEPAGAGRRPHSRAGPRRKPRKGRTRD